MLFLIPALLVPTKPKAPPPQPVAQEKRRETPPRPTRLLHPAPPEPPIQAPQPAQPSPTSYAQAGTPTAVASPALFPTTMFPSISPYSTPPQQAAQKPEGQESREELVEIVAAMALLRFLAGQGT